MLNHAPLVSHTGSPTNIPTQPTNNDTPPPSRLSAVNVATPSTHWVSNEAPSMQDPPEHIFVPSINASRPTSPLSTHSTQSAEERDSLNAYYSRMVCNMGFLINYYNLAVISSAKPLMRDHHQPSSPLQEGLVTSASLAGAIVGQLALGMSGDSIGRKYASVISGAALAIGALGTACAQQSSDDSTHFYNTLIAARFVLGVGAGGDLPLLSALTRENSSAEECSNALMKNNVWLGLGLVLSQGIYAGLIPIDSNEATWRTATGTGAFLCAALLLAKIIVLKNDAGLDHGDTNESTANSTALTLPHANHATPLLEQAPTVSTTERLGELSALWKPLVGASLSWLLYDAVDFALSLSSADILGSPDHPEQGAILTTFGASITMVGSLLAMALVNRSNIDQRQLQTIGFIGMSVTHGLLTATASLNLWQDETGINGAKHIQLNGLLGQMGFYGLYALQQLFDAAGPCVSVYVIPSEIFPTDMRASALGIASSIGKTGGFLGAASLPTIREATGMPTVFAITALGAALGAMVAQRMIPKYDTNTLDRLDTVFHNDGAQGVMNLFSENANIHRPDTTDSRATA